jgi:ankyrin repeat protein
LRLKHIIGSCAVVLLVSLGSSSSLGAAGSDVADAVMHGDGSAVRALLERKADVNAAQADGATALHWAVYRSDVNMVDLLIRAGADVKAANRFGATPLSLACENGDAAVVERLLKGGADANEALPRGETPLMFAARTGKVDAMKVLLDHRANVNAKETLRGTTALMWAAAQTHPAAVQLLIERGADMSARSDPAQRRRETARLGKANARSGGVAPGTPRAIAAAAAAKAAGLDEEDGLDGGGLTALAFAARQNDIESTRVLLAAGADINQVTGYGWTPLLVATQNRYYKLGSFLLDEGADPSIPNNGGWTPLYLAVDNRNIEGGDYPVRKGDMDPLEFIRKLLDKGADVNARMKDSTETRTVFTDHWLDEEGATVFLRASQSGDLPVMRLLLSRGADPKIATVGNITALQAAAGIGWVEGLTYEWSEAANVEAVKLLLDLGLDPNAQGETGRTALHGAAHKGRNAVVQLLVDAGARLDTRDFGNSDNRGGRLQTHTWLPVDYADGLVRVGVQSAIGHPETGLLIRKLMTERGLPAPPLGRTLDSICITEACQ